MQQLNTVIVLVSSKKLSRKLESFDLESQTIERVEVESARNLIRLVSNETKIPVWCDVLSYHSGVEQFGCRWDFLKMTLKYIPEQPIVLNLSNNRLQAVFNF